MLISVKVPTGSMTREQLADLISECMNNLAVLCGGLELNSDEEYMVEKNNMIAAVKLYKARTHLSLGHCLQVCRAYRGKFVNIVGRDHNNHGELPCVCGYTGNV